MTPIDTAELERLDEILRDPLSGLTWDNRIMAADAICEAITARARIAELEWAEDGFGGTIGSSAVGHLREMYPAAYEALGSSGRRSLRNYVNARAALATPTEGGSDERA